MRGRVSDHIARTQNATTGEEFRRGWGPEAFAPLREAERPLLVVGAGLAGMECAIVLARRASRRVHLIDAADEVGGYAAFAAGLPGLSEWRRAVEWRQRQLAISESRLQPGCAATWTSSQRTTPVWR